MNKAAYSIIGFCVFGLLVMLALNQPKNPEASHPALTPNHSSNQPKRSVQAPSSSIQNRDDELLARVEPAVDLNALGIDATPYKRDTDDTALIQIWATYKPKQIGSVKSAGAGRVTLELDDGRRFAATLIGEHRSKAEDGTIALDAITAPGATPIKNIDAEEGGITISGNPSEVWVIDPTGKTERISPEHVHAVWPEISPGGRYVAFTAQYLIGGALHSKVLMIKDRNTGELSSYAERKYGADYEIAPLDWIEGGKVLRVIEDWGETGGHTRLKQVRVE